MGRQNEFLLRSAVPIAPVSAQIDPSILPPVGERGRAAGYSAMVLALSTLVAKLATLVFLGTKKTGAGLGCPYGFPGCPSGLALALLPFWPSSWPFFLWPFFLWPSFWPFFGLPFGSPKKLSAQTKETQTWRIHPSRSSCLDPSPLGSRRGRGGVRLVPNR